MNRVTVDNIMTELASVVFSRYAVTASIRRFRCRETTEISPSPDYFIEPGGVAFLRRNVGACLTNVNVRVCTETTVEYSNAENAIKEIEEFYGNLARDLMAEPILPSTRAFLIAATTFSDAPACSSCAITLDGYAVVYGGVELTYQI